MSEPLQLTIDKFTFRVAAGRLYARDGIWVRPSDTSRVRLGVSDYFQQHNGDVAFANIKPAGTALRRDEPFAEVETMKVTIEVASPVSGKVLRVNEALGENPELINQDPYGEGWLVEIEAGDWEADRSQLLEPRDYLAAVQLEAERELRS